MPKGRLREFLFFFVRCAAEKGRTERSPLARNATPYDGSVLEIATMRVEGKGDEAIGIIPKMVNHQTRFLEKKGEPKRGSLTSPRLRPPAQRQTNPQDPGHDDLLAGGTTQKPVRQFAHKYRHFLVESGLPDPSQ